MESAEAEAQKEEAEVVVGAAEAKVDKAETGEEEAGGQQLEQPVAKVTDMGLAVEEEELEWAVATMEGMEAEVELAQK